MNLRLRLQFLLKLVVNLYAALLLQTQVVTGKTGNFSNNFWLSSWVVTIDCFEYFSNNSGLTIIFSFTKRFWNLPNIYLIHD